MTKYFVPATLALVLVILALVMYKGGEVPLAGGGSMSGCKNTDKGGIKGLSLTP